KDNGYDGCLHGLSHTGHGANSHLAKTVTDDADDNAIIRPNIIRRFINIYYLDSFLLFLTIP
ncbi:hypothetical protein AAAU98_27890, partial [Enterocloster citroniae]|uniref:hypothetical protein n=1 Tax=Enterocloster citroniae TaxID=358743 RepID=UPI0032BF640F